MRIAMMAHHPKTLSEKLRLYAAGLIVEEQPRVKPKVHRVLPPDAPQPRYVPRSKEPHDPNPPPED